MNQERNNQVWSILREYQDQEKNKDYYSRPIGCFQDPASHEVIGYKVEKLERNSKTVKQLESLGFKAVYPAELSEKEISYMDVGEKYVYESRMKNPLIIDTKETNLSLDYAQLISDHYLSAYRVPSAWGVNKNANSLTTTIDLGHYKEGTDKNLQKLLNSVGFNPTLDGEPYSRNFTVSSDIPYPIVKKSKFEQIYDKAKGKIKGMFEKLTSIVKPKDKIKENEQNERE